MSVDKLVTQSLLGSREAFGRIVARYQTLICSLAYATTGSLAQSEDLAQETFVAAWSQLSGLREPAKLRPWLCGIARNVAHRAWRGQKREPTAGAGPLERLDELPAPGPQPMEQAMSREEEAILWHSLESMPEVYRETLVLYYRQNQSVYDVALALDLSAEAVRQRLVRGRKLLTERVLGFTERALARSSPGRKFTHGVLSALPLAAPSGKAAALGTTWAAGSAAAKGSAVIGSLGGGLAMGGALISAQAEAATTTKSPRERRFVFVVVAIMLVAMVVFYETATGLFFGPRFASQIELAAGMLLYAVVTCALIILRAQGQRRIQIRDGTFSAAEWNVPRGAIPRGGSLGNRIQALAFPLTLGAAMVAPSLVHFRNHHDFFLTVLPLVIVFLVLLFFLAASRRRVKREPRYVGVSAPGFGSRITHVPILFAIITLVQFNVGRLIAGAGVPTATISQTIAFNVIVVLTYGIFALTLVRKRGRWKSLS